MTQSVTSSGAQSVPGLAHVPGDVPTPLLLLGGVALAALRRVLALALEAVTASQRTHGRGL